MPEFFLSLYLLNLCSLFLYSLNGLIVYLEHYCTKSENTPNLKYVHFYGETEEVSCQSTFLSKDLDWRKKIQNSKRCNGVRLNFKTGSDSKRGQTQNGVRLILVFNLVPDSKWVRLNFEDGVKLKMGSDSKQCQAQFGFKR